MRIENNFITFQCVIYYGGKPKTEDGVRFSTMKLDEFYKEVLKIEFSCLEFLKSFGMFSPSVVIRLGKHGIWCMKRMEMNTKKKRKGNISFCWRCSKKRCRNTTTIHNTNRFFTFQDSNGKATCNMSLRNMLLIVYYSSLAQIPWIRCKQRLITVVQQFVTGSIFVVRCVARRYELYQR